MEHGRHAGWMRDKKGDKRGQTRKRRETRAQRAISGGIIGI